MPWEQVYRNQMQINKNLELSNNQDFEKSFNKIRALKWQNKALKNTVFKRKNKHLKRKKQNKEFEKINSNNDLDNTLTFARYI